jgi:phosphohistidine phosphatase SixA
MLRSAGITHIFTTEFQRTRQTAAPLAEALKISPVMAAAKDTAALVRAVTAARGPALVVGHSNTVPEILSGLGVKEKITIAEQDYGNLFVVVRHGSGPPTLLHLRF